MTKTKQEKREIIDYKLTTVWSRIYASRLKDWEKQVNVYAYLWRRHAWPVSALKIVAFYRDWSRGRSKQGGDYPEANVEEIKVPLWDFQTQQNFVEDALQRLIRHEDTPDDLLPYCTPEEMWEKPTVYAVRKEGGKQAIKGGLFENKIDAEAFAEEKGKGHYVEVRPGERTRCEDYCVVRDFCNQYKDYKKQEVK